MQPHGKVGTGKQFCAIAAGEESRKDEKETSCRN